MVVFYSHSLFFSLLTKCCQRDFRHSSFVLWKLKGCDECFFFGCVLIYHLISRITRNQIAPWNHKMNGNLNNLPVDVKISELALTTYLHILLFAVLCVHWISWMRKKVSTNAPIMPWHFQWAYDLDKANRINILIVDSYGLYCFFFSFLITSHRPTSVVGKCFKVEMTVICQLKSH